MGNIIRRFIGKEDFAVVLEQLGKQIQEAEHRNRVYNLNWRKTITSLIYIFLFLEIIYGVWWYFFCPWTLTPSEKVASITVFAIIPVLWFLLFKTVGFYYHMRIANNEAWMAELEEDHQIKLDEFMTNGSYKDVVKVLEGINATNRVKTPFKGPFTPSTKGGPRASMGPSSTPQAPMAVQRIKGGDKKQPPTVTGTPSTPQVKSEKPVPDMASSSSTSKPVPPASVPAVQRLHLQAVPQSPMPQGGSVPRYPVGGDPQPQESKGWMDSVLDFLIGSSSTVPKLCKNCGAHNGLVPKEEIQNVSFVCVRCKTFNNGPAVSRDPNLSPSEKLSKAVQSRMESMNSADSSNLAESSNRVDDAPPSGDAEAEAESSAPSPADLPAAEEPSNPKKMN